MIDLDWIPSNVEEAKRKFKEMYKDDFVVSCMDGILRCKIGQGEEFIEAYKNTLYDYLKVPKSERK